MLQAIFISAGLMGALNVFLWLNQQKQINLLAQRLDVQRDVIGLLTKEIERR